MKTKFTIAFIGRFIICALLLAASFIFTACIPRDTIITELTEPLKKGVEEKYGYIIPDNAQLISGRFTSGSIDRSMELYFSIELDGLSGYEDGMEFPEIYGLMWDGRESDANNGIYFSKVDQDFEAEHGVKFDWYSQCEIAPFTGMWLSTPKNGKIFVYIDGYRPASSWYD